MLKEEDKVSSPFKGVAPTFEVKEFFVGRTKEVEFLRQETIERGRLVIVLGKPGVGKTSLVHFFAQENKKAFPGGVYFTYPYGQETLRSYVQDNIQQPVEKKTLLVVDEVHNLSREDFTYLRHLRDHHSLLAVILVGQRYGDTDPKHISTLDLAGLTKAEFIKLLRNRILHFRPDVADRFFQFVKGNPAATDAATMSVRDGLFTMYQLFDAFDSFQTSGILGPDGKPLRPGVSPPERLVVDVREVNDELIGLLKADPKLLRKITPRKFEEIIAELLARQGYKVELTPATRDGGLDMYAAKSDSLGTFLFLVECKQYTPPSKVGVQVIRSLYGTVQQSKATAGILVTTSFFTTPAQEFQREVKYQLQLRDFFEIKKWLGLI